jgi:L-rhamnose mutarotase
MKILSISCLIIFLFFCTSPQKDKYSKTDSKGKVLLTSEQLTKGFLEGLSLITYLGRPDLLVLNEVLKNSNIKFSLEFVYESAYDKKLQDSKQVKEVVFKDMKTATDSFQKVLKKCGVKNYSQYILTSLDKDSDYILFAVVERKQNFISVKNKFNTVETLSLNPDDPRFYEAYQKDSSNNPVDSIIDFGAVYKLDAQSESVQSILLTIATNSVITKKKSPDYWAKEKLWLEGKSEQVLEENSKRMDALLK